MGGSHRGSFGSATRSAAPSVPIRHSCTPYSGIWNAWAPKCGHGGEDPYDATANVAVAACMQAADGWAPWGL